jgi:molybdopterin converting factor small subunit
MSISVTVEFLAGIRVPSGQKTVKLELEDNATVRDALLAAGCEGKQIEFFRVWRGEELVDLHTRLEDSDKLLVAIPLSGGDLTSS